MPVINYRDLKSREGYIGILGYTIGLDTAWMILLLYIEFAWIYKREPVFERIAARHVYQYNF